MIELQKAWKTVEILRNAVNSGGYFAFEINRECNRRCPHCKVPSLYNRDTELSVESSCRAFDWLYSNGFGIGTVLGGEPLGPFQTKEGITFYDHTLAMGEYGHAKNMLLGLSTNGDHYTEKKAKELSRSYSWITFSLHTPTKKSLDSLVEYGQISAVNGMIPIIHTLITRENADNFPWIAAYIAKNGLLVNATVVQEKDGSFSSKPEISQMPTLDQQIKVFEALDILRKFGLVRINGKLLKESSKYYPNSWKCSPERDYFIHIGAGGTLDVCEEMRTDLTFEDVDSLEDIRWRQSKRKLIENCSGCLYRCYFESENPNLRGDWPALVTMGLLKTGKIDLSIWGQVATEAARRLKGNIDWSQALK